MTLDPAVDSLQVNKEVARLKIIGMQLFQKNFGSKKQKLPDYLLGKKKTELTKNKKSGSVLTLCYLMGLLLLSKFFLV